MTTSLHPMRHPMHLQRRGPAEYVLWNRTREIGRIRGHVLRLHGFATEHDAHAAGRAACDVLAQWYRERDQLGHDATVTAWDDASAIAPAGHLTLDGIVVGRILTRGGDDGRNVGAHDRVPVVPALDSPVDDQTASTASAPGRARAERARRDTALGFELALPHTLLHAVTMHLLGRLHAAAAPWRVGPDGEPSMPAPAAAAPAAAAPTTAAPASLAPRAV